jgi:hypothetical protein
MISMREVKIAAAGPYRWVGHCGDYPAVATCYGVGVNGFFAAMRTALPTDPVPGGQPSSVEYFAQTRHTVANAFLRFFLANGGSSVFGLPLTEAYAADDGVQAQYFEHARLELRQGQVAITQLGTQLTAARHFAPSACCGKAGEQWFATTQHTLAAPFLAYWQAHHGALLFGDPISQPLREQNGDGTGRTYLMQYFQNVRLEYHPELAGTKYAVLIGLLGTQAVEQRGWL